MLNKPGRFTHTFAANIHFNFFFFAFSRTLLHADEPVFVITGAICPVPVLWRKTECQTPAVTLEIAVDMCHSEVLPLPWWEHSCLLQQRHQVSCTPSWWSWRWSGHSTQTALLSSCHWVRSRADQSVLLTRTEHRMFNEWLSHLSLFGGCVGGDHVQCLKSFTISQLGDDEALVLQVADADKFPPFFAALCLSVGPWLRSSMEVEAVAVVGNPRVWTKSLLDWSQENKDSTDSRRWVSESHQKSIQRPEDVQMEWKWLCTLWRTWGRTRFVADVAQFLRAGRTLPRVQPSHVQQGTVVSGVRKWVSCNKMSIWGGDWT